MLFNRAYVQVTGELVLLHQAGGSSDVSGSRHHSSSQLRGLLLCLLSHWPIIKHRHNPFSTQTHHSKSEIRYLFGNTHTQKREIIWGYWHRQCQCNKLLLDFILLNKTSLWWYYYGKINWFRLDYINKWPFVLNTAINLVMIKPRS